jgi:hypothetical protein
MSSPDQRRLRVPQRPLAPERLRLGREVELRETLGKSSEIRSWLEEQGESIRELQMVARRHHLASSVRVTPRISPQLAKRFDAVRRILGTQFHAELYVEHSADIKASCVGIPDGSLVVTMTAGAAEKLEALEQLFLIGHELGHFLLDHHELPVGVMLAHDDAGESAFTPRVALQLLAWSRCCEISADRFGLICCQNEGVVARTFMKLASGLPSGMLGTSEDYLDQLDEWIEHRGESEGWFSTHPLHAIRIHAAQSFWRSTHVSDLFGEAIAAPTRMCADEADAHARRMLAAMDPDPSTLEEDDNHDLLDAFLACAGVHIVACDGEIDPRELPVLLSMASEARVSQAIGVLQSDDPHALVSQIAALCERLLQETDDATHCRLLLQLLVLAYVDGHVATEELELLRDLAAALKVAPMTVDILVDRLQHGEEPVF